MSEGKIKILVEAVDKATEVLKSVGKQVEGLAKNTTGLKGVAKTAAGVMLGELAHDALGAVTHAAGDASKGFMDYEQTLSAVVASSGVTGKAAEKLRSELDKVAKNQTSLGYSADQAAAALESLVKAGLSGTDAAKALQSSLAMARIEGINTAQASDMLVGVMNQFGYAASDASKVVDTLVNASIAGVGTASDFALGLSYCGAQAASMGISLQETAAALVAMNNQGIAAEKAGRYLGAMFTDLINKSDKLGFNIYDSNGKMLSLSKIIGKLSKKLKALASDEERNTYLTEVFGTQGARAALSLLNLSEGGKSASNVLISLTDTLNKEGSANSYVNQILDTTAGKMSQAQAQTENASYALGQMTAQLQLTWAQFAIGLGPIGAVANALGPSLLQGAMSGVMIMLPQLVAAITSTSAATQAWGVITAATSKLITVSIMGIPIIGWIAGIIAAITLLYEAWVNNWGGIRDRVQPILNGLKAAWDAFVSGLKWAWDNILKPIADFLINTFGAALNTVKNALDAISAPLKSVTDALGSVGDALGSVIGNLFGSPKTIFEDAANGVEKLRKQMGKLKPVGWEKMVIPSGWLGVGAIGAGSVSVSGPLVYVEGSVDRRTAEYAAHLMEEKLKTVLIEATSTSAPTKRIRIRG